jgi:hypothetical protein
MRSGGYAVFFVLVTAGAAVAGFGVRYGDVVHRNDFAEARQSLR